MPRKSILKIKADNNFAIALKLKFPQLKQYTNNYVLQKLLEDYVEDFIFDAKYFNERDIEEIFSMDNLLKSFAGKR